MKKALEIRVTNFFSQLVYRSAVELDECSLKDVKIDEDQVDGSKSDDETDDTPRNFINPFLKRLKMDFHIEYKQDKSINSVSVTCVNAHKAIR